MSGIADHHPRLGSKVYVGRTSSLQRYSMEEDILIYETRNTIYVCPLKYMTQYPYRNVIPEYKEELTHRAERSESCLDLIIGAAAKPALQVNDGDEFVTHLKELQEKGYEELVKQAEEENKRLMEDEDGLDFRYFPLAGNGKSIINQLFDMEVGQDE